MSSDSEDDLLLAMMEKTVDQSLPEYELDQDALQTWLYPLNKPLRAYQKKITETALFCNTLVSLPTGLGKTFIASSVMLNWWRWTKDAKIIFMAPTRPLVSQQLEACLGLTGIPRQDASVMMGNLNKAQRSWLWNEKRVFFATPQTVQNDLSSGLLDATQVACIIVDEAHRATGNASYVNVVNNIYLWNRACRIVGLTATPARYIEGAQVIADNLRIGAMEVLTDRDPEVAQYVFDREMVEEMVKTEATDVETIQKLFVKSYEADFIAARTRGILRCHDPLSLTQMAALDSISKLAQLKTGNQATDQSLYFRMMKLVQAGRLITLLNLHGVVPFYKAMCELQDEALGTEVAPKQRKYAKFVKSKEFVATRTECEKLLQDPHYLGHPKLEKLVDIMHSYYSTNPDTRAIIFVQYRQSAEHIIRVLKHHTPKVKPALFVGQATAKRTAGMKQREQEQAVAELRKGVTVNAIVATSIGEEGLDIGQVDLIVCYDQSKSPIRTIQRMGRTGRAKDGAVHFLMTDKEKSNLEYALKGYEVIQESLESTAIDLAPINRIVPSHIAPKCEPKIIEIPKDNQTVLDAEDVLEKTTEAQAEELRRNESSVKVQAKKRRMEAQLRKGGSSSAPKAKKRFFMPDNVPTGFRSAADALKEQTQQLENRQG